ncbi:MAG TPA: FRG domain-containing protein [Bacteroidales bacterium]|nr:FRG domain-containing protein [Bacteroidales bacterium]
MSGFKIFKAANVEEAVEMAIRLKKSGEYNLFRGQVSDWPPHSSLFRLETTNDEKKLLDHNNRVDRFYQWLQLTPELQTLAKDENASQVIAIMQHYGIKTHYIDFTTDPAVAGFFAGDTPVVPTEGNSCIYCLNSDDLFDQWEIYKKLDLRQDAIMEMIHVDVSNLWRLQSQKGVFVCCNYNWEIDYPMDKIVFPYSGYPSYPPKEIIYPIHKSPLEQLLDQYFANEASVETYEMMEEFFSKLRKQGQYAEIREITPMDKYLYADAFNDASSLNDHPSWNDFSLASWNIVSNEIFDETVGTFETIVLKVGAKDAELSNSIRFAIKQVLARNDKQRTKAIEWVFKNLPSHVNEKQLKSQFNIAWNGMRRLPYSDEEIATCMANIFLLLAQLKKENPLSNQLEAAHSSLFGANIRIGFTVQDYSGSIGFASIELLNEAMRHDLPQLVTEKYSSYLGNPKEIFRIIYNTRVLFDFQKLKRIFVEQLIPTQIVGERSPIIFNLARVIITGNP